ncbi:MAG: histidinol-phosphate transaminase [Pseudomonadota bacterium]
MTVQAIPHLAAMAPYKVADSTIPGVERVIHLASNESAVAPSPVAVAAYREAANDLRLYPDAHFLALKHAIADLEGIDPARIVCGGGSMELIQLLALSYLRPGDEVIYSQYAYLFILTAINVVGATAVAAPERNLLCNVDGILERVTPATRAVFLVNPNNPTGALLPNSEVERLRQSLRPDILLVLDAAYAEFVEDLGYDPGTKLATSRDNVVMLRTFSKIYGLAAVRLGWAYCPPAVAEILHKVRNPSNTSAPAQAAALAALDDQDHVARHRAENARRRDAFSARVAALGLTPYPSHGNFVLISFGGGDNKIADAAFDYFKTQGIILRPMADYGLADCLRVTIGTEEEMDLALAALERFVRA